MVVAASAREAAGRVEPYPAPPGARRSNACSVTVDGRAVRTVRYKDVSYAHFGFTESVRVTVKSSERIDEHWVSPKSYGIVADVDGRELSFTLDGPRKLIVHVSDTEKAFVFADPIDKDPPRPGATRVKSVLDFGVDPTGKTLETERLQRAIDEVSSARAIRFTTDGNRR